MLGGLVGFTAGMLFWAHYRHASQTAKAWSGTAVFDTVADPRMGAYGPSVRARMIEGPFVGSEVDLRFSSKVSLDELAYGSRLRCGVRMQRYEPDEWGRRAHRRGSIARATVYEYEGSGFPPGIRGRLALLRKTCGKILEGGRGEVGALLRSLVVGDTTSLAGSSIEETFRITGLSHIVAISGSHLTLIASLAGVAISRLPFGPRARNALLLGLLTGFVFLTGANPSALRSLFMVGLAYLAQFGKRRGDPLSATALCVVVFLLLNPSLGFNVGFALSVLAVVGIVLLGPLFKEWFMALLARQKREQPRSRPMRFIAESLALTFSAQLLTLPITIPTFGMISLVSPLSNLLVAPLLTAALNVGVVGLLVSIPAKEVGRLVINGAALCARGGIAAAELCARIPYAARATHGSGLALGLIAAAILVLIWAWWPRPRKKMALCIVLAVVLAAGSIIVKPPYKGDRIVMLDVGQGDATIVQSGGKTLLIDGGPEPQVLREELHEFGVQTLDAVILTHLHDDHYGGLVGLKGYVSVDALYLPKGALTGDISASEAATLHEIENGMPGAVSHELIQSDVLRFGDARFTVLSPKESVDPGENESSVVGLLELGGIKAVFTGDAESEVFEAIIADARLQGFIGDIDILKVGHHGSAISLDEHILNTVKPEVALIGVGADNSFGHPTPTALAFLKRALCTIYRTDRNGSIEVDVRGNTFTVTPQNP